jgi:putative ABC transport system substrate-binding protein
VIATVGGPVAALAAKTATATIPIVFAAVSDPVKSGLVASLNRPGGNITGNAGLTIELDGKRLEILGELAPGAKLVGALINSNRSGVEVQEQDLLAAASHAATAKLVLASTKVQVGTGTMTSPDRRGEHATTPVYDARR